MKLLASIFLMVGLVGCRSSYFNRFSSYSGGAILKEKHHEGQMYRDRKWGTNDYHINLEIWGKEVDQEFIEDSLEQVKKDLVDLWWECEREKSK